MAGDGSTLSHANALPTAALDKYLAEGLGHPVPEHANPADHAIDLVNTDFIKDPAERTRQIDSAAQSWTAYAEAHPAHHQIVLSEKGDERLSDALRTDHGSRRSRMGHGFRVGLSRTGVLMERNILNYSRNLLAYGVRVGMYGAFVPVHCS